MNSTPERESRYLAASDGLRLHYLDFAGDAETAPVALPPVVCLPGLARSAEDFRAVAAALQAQGRRVLALDYRGRGLSQWDPDWRHYDFDVEQDDIFTVLGHENIDHALFIGTSRGGLHMMRIAAAKPGLILAGAMNDIGPEIDHAGLLRIKRYVGKLPPIATMADAIGLMRLTAGQHFSGVSADEWAIYARQTFVERGGKIELRYDPALSHSLDSVSPEKPAKTHWDEFDALAKVPLLVLRGANSDLLTQAVFDEMARRAPAMQRYTVPGQGHAPLLLDAPSITRIANFMRDCAARSGGDASDR